MKIIYDENTKNPLFLKFSNTFFNFIIKLTNDQYISISTIALDIINNMLSIISGVNLVTNVHFAIPNLIKLLGNPNLQIRKKIIEILEKFVMIVPTSQFIPYLLNNLISDNWMILYQSLEFLFYIFNNLNSIYNDIDFKGNNYDISIFLEVFKLVENVTPKVVQSVKKLIKFIGSEIIETENFLKTIEFYVSQNVYKKILNIFDKNLKDKSEIKNEKDFASNRIIDIINHKENGEDVEDYQNFVIYKKLVNYENQPITDHPNVDEYLMDSKFNSIENKKDLNSLKKNYSNYNLEIENKNLKKNEIKNKIMKSRLKRYNDPTDHNLEEHYDKNYIYDYKPRETLSPLKHPESNYNNLYVGLKSHLNWEKQYKCLDNLRKIIYYESKILIKDSYMTNLIIDEVINLTHSIRSLLVKNALVTLSEIVGVEGLNLSNKYEIIFKVLIKKILDKNEFISKESQKSLDQLVLHCDIGKASLSLLNTFIKITFNENILININIFTKMIYFHDKNFINHKNFNRVMNYITEIFHKHKTNVTFRESLKNYFLSLYKYFNDDEKYEKFLKLYYGYETLNKILELTNE